MRLEKKSNYEVSSKINATLSIVALSEVLRRLKRTHLKGLNLMNKLAYQNLWMHTSGGPTEDFKRYTSSDLLQLTLMVL